MKNIFRAFYLLGLVLVIAGCGGLLGKTTGTPGVQSQLYNIYGQVLDLTGSSSMMRDVYVILDGDTDNNNGYVKKIRLINQTMTANYSFSNIPQGTYYIRAFKDNNNTGQFSNPDSGDAYGVFANGNPNQQVNLNNGDLMINFWLDTTL